MQLEEVVQYKVHKTSCLITEEAEVKQSAGREEGKSKVKQIKSSQTQVAIKQRTGAGLKKLINESQMKQIRQQQKDGRNKQGIQNRTQTTKIKQQLHEQKSRGVSKRSLFKHPAVICSSRWTPRLWTDGQRRRGAGLVKFTCGRQYPAATGTSD